MKNSIVVAASSRHRQIIGFSQDHLSGTGCTDLGGLCIMPFRSYDMGGELVFEMCE